MALAIEVASRLLNLAAAEDEPEGLTHMRLQKLLYYVQGWSLGIRNKPAFEEDIQAWAHGPVVRDLYRYFADYGNSQIDAGAFAKYDDLEGDDCEFVRDVWEVYKPFSATKLRSMTHSEEPWLKARGTSGPADQCDTVITVKSMKKFFKKLAAE